MQKAINKALAEGSFVRRVHGSARNEQVFTNEGRMFLDANALQYGAAVNAEGP